jgi:hypothetical protein
VINNNSRSTRDIKEERTSLREMMMQHKRSLRYKQEQQERVNRKKGERVSEIVKESERYERIKQNFESMEKSDLCHRYNEMRAKIEEEIKMEEVLKKSEERKKAKERTMQEMSRDAEEGSLNVRGEQEDVVVRDFSSAAKTEEYRDLSSKLEAMKVKRDKNLTINEKIKDIHGDIKRRRALEESEFRIVDETTRKREIERIEILRHEKMLQMREDLDLQQSINTKREREIAQEKMKERELVDRLERERIEEEKKIDSEKRTSALAIKSQQIKAIEEKQRRERENKENEASEIKASIEHQRKTVELASSAKDAALFKSKSAQVSANKKYNEELRKLAEQKRRVLVFEKETHKAVPNCFSNSSSSNSVI